MRSGWWWQYIKQKTKQLNKTQRKQNSRGEMAMNLPQFMKDAKHLIYKNEEETYTQHACTS